MSEWRDAFDEGQKHAPIRSTRAGIIRGCVDGALVATVIWGFGPLWFRVVYCAVLRLVYGAFASSRRFAGKL